MLLAAPALIEADSVLTRLPAPFRLSPAHALQLLEAKLLSYAAEVVTLGAAACRQLLSEAARQNTAGGRVDNAVVVACGLAAKADVVLTCYERQFVPLTGPEIAIVVPA